MNEREFADTIISMPTEKQNEFFEALKGQLPEEDRIAVMKYISLWGMYNNPAKYNAMKNAVLDMLCEEFYGHPHEEPETPAFDRSIDYPPYMTTIL